MLWADTVVVWVLCRLWVAAGERAARISGGRSAGGFKHKALTRASLDSDFNLYREYEHFAVEVGQNPIQYRVAFADGDPLREYDLFDFAERRFKLWRVFIEDLDPRHGALIT